jgi:hypothetical protein
MPDKRPGGRGWATMELVETLIYEGTGHKVKGGLGKIEGGSLFLSPFEGVGHGKLSAFIRVGHVKICRNFFKGMCIKIHIIKIEIKRIRVHV